MSGKFTTDVLKYKSIDSEGTLPAEKIAEELGWKKNTAYIFKYFISELTEDELRLLDAIDSEIDLEIIKAISLLQPQSRAMIWPQVERILNAPSPFAEIDKCLEEIKGPDPLFDIRQKYWLCVGEYLKHRNIDQHPFSKSAIYFINGIGFKGYAAQSSRQRKYIYDLIANDKKRPEHDRFFTNEHVVNKGYTKECAIIKKLRSTY